MESNHRHKDFQSFALPTELHHRFGVRKSRKKLKIPKFISLFRHLFLPSLSLCLTCTKLFLMYLTIDQGNSFCKIIVFHNNIAIHREVCKVLTARHLQSIYKKYNIDAALACSVIGFNSILKKAFKKMRIDVLSATTKIPIKNLYTTPKTLGKDRLANVIAATFLFPKQNVLIIDAGTCIKYDLIDHSKKYKGGNISPGLMMRFLALNKFTRKLPLAPLTNPRKLIGDSTVTALQTGVFNGIVAEMEGLAARYAEKYSDLKVILTGGDTNRFVSQLNLSIFAASDLVNIGLNEIIKHNAEH